MHGASAKHAEYSAAANEAQQELDRVACEEEQSEVQNAMTTQHTGLDVMIQLVLHLVDGIETVVAQNPLTQMPEDLREMVGRSRDIIQRAALDQQHREAKRERRAVRRRSESGRRRDLQCLGRQARQSRRRCY